ncbi:Uncharacterized protein dnm_041540 [Desulfonema magnum]|uniref:Uncharacterized protein n=1 Tax=Desulfonema magnum TaxID=45655 RepID=A0A975BMW7_9BACT|nr:Uncharacterized protein dnm_041540 [Desulfonema magnum]
MLQNCSLRFKKSAFGSGQPRCPGCNVIPGGGSIMWDAVWRYVLNTELDEFAYVPAGK